MIPPQWVKVRLDGADVKHQSRKPDWESDETSLYIVTGAFLSANSERMSRVDTAWLRMDTEANLMSMADLAKANGIRVVLSSVMPVCDYIRPQTERRPPAKIMALVLFLFSLGHLSHFSTLAFFLDNPLFSADVGRQVFA